MLRARRIAWIALVLCPAIASADPPPASFDIDFSGDAAIWNPFDDFEACESILGATLCLTLSDVECDGKGKCQGDASFAFSGTLDGELTGPFTASAKCKPPKLPGGDVCKAQISSCDTAGQVSGFEATIDACSLKGPVLGNGLFDAFGKARVCLVGVVQPGKRTCQSGSGGFSYFVNPPTPWTLSVTIADDDGKLAGTASDDLGFEYAVKGRYKDSDDGTKLALKGMKGSKEMPDPSKGASIKITDLVMSGSTVVSGEARIKVQGHKATTQLD